MSKCHVAVWDVISNTCMVNLLQVLAYELDCQSDFHAMRNLFVTTTVRGEVKFQSLSLNTFNTSAQAVSLCFDSLRCFDPGGLLSFLCFPSHFVLFQFLLRPLLSSVYPFSSISSQTSSMTIEFQTIESSLGQASGWPWVPKVIRIHSKFKVSKDIYQWKLQKFLVEWKNDSITIFNSSSCCWSEYFVVKGMHTSIGEACSHLANVDAYGTALVHGNMLGDSWLKILGQGHLKLDTSILYDISYPSKRTLAVLKNVELMVVLHRKMIYNGSFLAHKVLSKWKGWFLKHGSWKFADVIAVCFGLHVINIKHIIGELVYVHLFSQRLEATGIVVGFPSLQKWYDIKVKNALKHLIGSSAKKVTLNPATLFNKGLEVIEAHYLFGAEYDEIVIHPQSITP